MNVTLIGCGCGDITGDARTAISEAGLLIGSKRLLDAYGEDKPQIEAYFSVDQDFEDMLRSRGKAKEADAVHTAATLPITFAYQDDPKGLGHAVLCAAEAVAGKAVIIVRHMIHF